MHSSNGYLPWCSVTSQKVSIDIPRKCALRVNSLDELNLADPLLSSIGNASHTLFDIKPNFFLHLIANTNFSGATLNPAIHDVKTGLIAHTMQEKAKLEVFKTNNVRKQPF